MLLSFEWSEYRTKNSLYKCFRPETVTEHGVPVKHENSTHFPAGTAASFIAKMSSSETV